MYTDELKQVAERISGSQDLSPDERKWLTQHIETIAEGIVYFAKFNRNIEVARLDAAIMEGRAAREADQMGVDHWRSRKELLRKTWSIGTIERLVRDQTSFLQACSVSGNTHANPLQKLNSAFSEPLKRYLEIRSADGWVAQQAHYRDEIARLGRERVSKPAAARRAQGQRRREQVRQAALTVLKAQPKLRRDAVAEKIHGRVGLSVARTIKILTELKLFRPVG